MNVKPSKLNTFIVLNALNNEIRTSLRTPHYAHYAFGQRSVFMMMMIKNLLMAELHNET